MSARGRGAGCWWDVIAIITARGGSKGIPGKNLKPLGGKPLVDWTIEAAITSDQIESAYLSSDDPKILERAKAHGIGAIERPAELALDESSQVDAVLHALDVIGSDPWAFTLLQPTSPLRTAHDISNAVKLLRERGVDAVVSVSAARTHPYLARRVQEDGRVIPFIEPPQGYLRRQDLPPALELNGAIYTIRTESLRRELSFEPKSTLAYEMPVERSVDIDSPMDLLVAEALIEATYG